MPSNTPGRGPVTTEREALDRIAAVCAEVPDYAGRAALHLRDMVVAVLAEAAELDDDEWRTM